MRLMRGVVTWSGWPGLPGAQLATFSMRNGCCEVMEVSATSPRETLASISFAWAPRLMGMGAPAAQHGAAAGNSLHRHGRADATQRDLAVAGEGVGDRDVGAGAGDDQIGH